METGYNEWPRHWQSLFATITRFRYIEGLFLYILLSIITGVKKSVRYTMDFVIERFVIWWFHCKVQTLHLRMKRLLTMYTRKDPATETR